MPMLDSAHVRCSAFGRCGRPECELFYFDARLLEAVLESILEFGFLLLEHLLAFVGTGLAILLDLFLRALLALFRAELGLVASGGLRCVLGGRRALVRAGGRAFFALATLLFARLAGLDGVADQR